MVCCGIQRKILTRARDFLPACPWKSVIEYVGKRVPNINPNVTTEEWLEQFFNSDRTESVLKLLGTHKLSQSLVEGAHCQTLYNTTRSGASESSSEIRHMRQERDSLIICGRTIETDMQSLRDAVSCFEAQFAHIPRLRGMLDVKRQKSNTLHADTLRLSRQFTPRLS